MNDIINFCIDIIDEFIEDTTIKESSKKYLNNFYSKLTDLTTKYENAMENKIYTNFREYVIESLKLFIYDNSDKSILIMKKSEILERINTSDFRIKYKLDELDEL